jgi:hypothetical protein
MDPKISRWLSGDPALGEYVPQAGRQPGGLPGMGGVFNIINMHSYHYAGNNPVKYIDPDGKTPRTYRAIGTVDGRRVDRYIFFPSSMGDNVVSSIFKDIIPFVGGSFNAHISERHGFRDIVEDDQTVGSTLLGLISNISGTVSNISTFADFFDFSSKFLLRAGNIGSFVSAVIALKNVISELSQRVSVDLDYIIKEEFGNLLSASTHEKVSILYFYVKERMEKLYKDGAFSYTTGRYGIEVNNPKNGEFNLLRQELRFIRELMGE